VTVESRRLTDFPGESSVSYIHDGLGRMRNKVLNPSAPADGDFTWYRYGAGFDRIGRYAAGTDTGTVWDIGAATRTYVGAAAYIDGATPYRTDLV